MRSTTLRRPVLAAGLQSTTATAATTTTSRPPTIAIRQSTSARSFHATPTPQARLIRRPKRPYTFTQLIQLTDGSTYTHRTTSPLPLYKAVKDSRNNGMWQPTDRRLMNVEVDEAGKLALFRARFGRGFDFVGAQGEGDGLEGKKAGEAEEQREGVEGEGEQEEDLSDLISGYASEVPVSKKEVRIAGRMGGGTKKK